jgi:hypothetical protein
VSWLVRRYILSLHEQVAMSKLPRHTFRFRYDAGELVFCAQSSSSSSYAMATSSCVAVPQTNQSLYR